MSQEISNPVTHAIIFHDKTHKLITTSQYNYILSNTANTYVQTPSLGYFALSSIARIIEVGDFYDQFPDKKPKYLNYTLPQEGLPPERPDNRTPEQRETAAKWARSEIIRGLQEYCDEHPKAKNARAILKSIQGGGGSKTYWDDAVEKYADRVRNPSEEAHYQFALKKQQQEKRFYQPA